MPYAIPGAKQAEDVFEKIDYPVTKEQCIKQAAKQGATEDTLAMLESLPVDAFDSASELKVAIQVTKL